jgi:5-deoxy-glucuronate isomerase
MDQLIFRKTNTGKGRTLSITPHKNSSMQHLVYGRIILDESLATVRFSTEKLETGLICMSGECAVTAGGQVNEIRQYDSIYLPRDTDVEITTSSSVDLVECSAEVEKKYPLQVVRYADVEKDASLRFKTGSGGEFAHGEYHFGEERRSGAHPGRLYDFGTRALDQLAPARTRSDARRALRFL